MRSDENSAYYGPADGQLFPTELMVIVTTTTAAVHDGLVLGNGLFWEAQRRGLLADGTLSGGQVAAICDGVGPGSAEWLGEQVIRSSVTRTAVTSARTIGGLAENESLSPGQLINHALHALGPLDDVRTRWRTANDHSPPSPAPASSSNGPSPARVHAALARSTPHPISPSSARARSASGSAAVRSPSRGHS